MAPSTAPVGETSGVQLMVQVIPSLKAIQKEIHENFIALVKSRRGGKLDGADETGRGSGGGQESMSAVEAIGKMPYDFSPARMRCMELADELAASESPVP